MSNIKDSSICCDRTLETKELPHGCLSDRGLGRDWYLGYCPPARLTQFWGVWFVDATLDLFRRVQNGPCGLVACLVENEMELRATPRKLIDLFKGHSENIASDYIGEIAGLECVNLSPLL